MKGSLTMKQQSLKMNALLNGIKQCCAIIFPLITFPYVSRVLGSDGFGKYSFSASIVNYFALIAALGVNIYAIREGAKIRGEAKELRQFCSQVFSVNVCSSMIAYVLLTILFLFSTKIQEYAPYIVIQSIAIFLNTIGTDWVNSIFEDYRYITLRYILFQILALIAMFIFVRTAQDVIRYCIIYVFASAGGNLLNIVYVRRYVKIKFTWNMNLKQHLMPLLILFINSIAIMIYVNSDITMLGFYHNDEIVGIYSFTTKIYTILKQMVNAVIVVAIPRIAFSLKNEYEKYLPYINKVFRVVSVLLLPIVVGTIFVSKSIISIAGGEGYLAGTVSLQILSIALVFAMYSSIITNCVLIVNQNEKKCLIATAVSAFINIILNFILIPKFGMNAAAITTMFAEIMNFLIQGFYAQKYVSWKQMEYRPILSCALGCVVISMVCLGSNYFFDVEYLKIVIAVMVSSILYVVILIITKHPIVKDVKIMLKSFKI